MGCPLSPPRDPETILKFSTDAVNHVAEAYCPIIRKHMNDPFTPEEKQWQLVRTANNHAPISMSNVADRKQFT